MGRRSSLGWEAVAAASMDGVGLVRDGEYVRANARLAAIYGRDDPGDLRGSDWAALHEFDRRDVGAPEEESAAGEPPPAEPAAGCDGSATGLRSSADGGPPADPGRVLARARATGAWRGPGRVRRADEGTVPALVSLAADADGLVAVVRDLSRARHAVPDPAGVDRVGQDGPGRPAALEARTGIPAAVTELELRVTDPDSPLVALSADLEGTLSLAGYAPADEGWLLYLDVEGTTAAAAVDAARDLVAHARVVTDEGRDRRVEVALAGRSLFETVRAGGGTVQAAEAAAGTVTLVVTLPAAGRVRTFVDRVRAAFPAADLVARRERDRPPDRAGAPDDYLADLTERQRRALEVAYRSGYFDWPRESTAEEVASSLDLAAPTLHAHLRKAEARLFAALLDGR